MSETLLYSEKTNTENNIEQMKVLLKKTTKLETNLQCIETYINILDKEEDDLKVYLNGKRIAAFSGDKNIDWSSETAESIFNLYDLDIAEIAIIREKYRMCIAKKKEFKRIRTRDEVALAETNKQLSLL